MTPTPTQHIAIASHALAAFFILIASGGCHARSNPFSVSHEASDTASAHTGIENNSKNNTGASFDHATFDELIKQNVNDEGLVDYKALSKRSQALDAYLDQLADAELEALSEPERLALLINAYNAFTLKLILDHWDDGRIDSIKDIPASKRWEAQRWDLGGERVSLNQIEHQIIRKQFDEPRIHWALVCAAIDCPPLRREAYTGQKLDAQLADQTRLVHSSEQYVEFDAGTGTLRVTSLYKWYGQDFGEGKLTDVVLAEVARHHEGVADARAQGRDITIKWLDYDWSLNAPAEED